MATRKISNKSPVETQQITKALSPMDQPERMQLGEIGYKGLSIFAGVSTDELRRELQWPYSIQTYKNMSYHSAVNSALTLYENLIGKATWKVVPPQQATAEEKQQTERVREMLTDMEHSFPEFIKDALSMNIFGFSVHEKVYRRRYKRNGSMYDDGLIGWKKLPIRAQESIEKFIFSEDGNEVLGVKQNLTGIDDYYNRYSARVTKEVVLPKDKVMLFKAGRHRGDPFGKSMLRECYLAWRYLTAIEQIESNGVARDVSGIPVLTIPAQYMSADASPEQKVLYESFKNIVRNLQMNDQSGLVLPSAVDPETRQKMFSLELLSMDGSKNYDTTKVKEYYKNLILTSLFADVLVLGQSSGGSYALSQTKNSLTGAAAEAMLKSIVEVINEDLIKQTYELNGWNPARACKIDYDDLADNDLETLSKYWQRISSVGLVEKDRAVLNSIRVAAGIDAYPDDMPVQEDKLTASTSRAGDGMKTAGAGTSTNPMNISSGDNNLENVG